MFSYLFQHFSKKFSQKRLAEQLKPPKVQAEQKTPPPSGEKQIYYYDNKTREIPSLTTEYSKTRYLENGQMELTAFTTPHYYQDENGKWQDIDMHIEGGKIKHGLYQAELLKDGYGYTIRHRDDTSSMTVRLKSVGNLTPEFKQPIIEGNEARWEQIVPGVDLLISFERGGVRVWRQLHDDKAPKDIFWEVDEEEGVHRLGLAKNILGSDQKERLTYVIRTKISESKEDNFKRYVIKDTFTGQVIEMSKATHRKELQNDTVYPVMIDADIDINPSASGDDGGAKKFNGAVCATFNVANTSRRIGQTITTVTAGIYRYRAFFRFSGITITQSITIISAKLRLHQVGSSNVGNPTVTIKAKKVNDPGNPANCAGVYSPATLATNTVQKVVNTNVASTPIVYTEFTITTIVQELVNAYAYTNQHMLFFAKTPNVTKSIRVHMQDKTGTTKDPNLQITYTAPTTNGIFFGVDF